MYMLSREFLEQFKPKKVSEDFLERFEPEKPASSPPNYTHLEEWANSQITPMLRQIARKMVAKLNHVPFQTFIEQLKMTVEDFHARTENQPYVIVIAESNPTKFREGCSDFWVIGLAFRYASLREPQSILNLYTIKSYLEKNPTIKNVLVLDDAAYSGTQKTKAMKEFYQSCNDIPKLNVYMGIAYLTLYAKNRMEEVGSGKGLQFLKHGQMLPISEAFDANEQRYINSLEMLFLQDSMGITLTYFDHRYPDFMSAYKLIYTGTDIFPGFQIGFLMGIYSQYSREQPDPAQTEGVCNDAENLTAQRFNELVDKFIPNYNREVIGYTIPKITPPYDKRPITKKHAPIAEYNLFQPEKQKESVFKTTVMDDTLQKRIDGEVFKRFSSEVQLSTTTAAQQEMLGGCIVKCRQPELQSTLNKEQQETDIRVSGPVLSTSPDSFWDNSTTNSSRMATPQEEAVDNAYLYNDSRKIF